MAEAGESERRVGRVGGIARVRGHGSYGIALTFDLIPLPATRQETPRRPLPSGVLGAPARLRGRFERETLSREGERESE